MANTYLTRTPSSAGNRKTFTISAWCKFSRDSGIDTILSAGADGNNRTIFIRNGGANGDIRFLLTLAGTGYNVISENFLRDLSGWYHLVLAVDTTQATASDRIKMYINGTEVVYNTTDYPPINTDLFINNNIEQNIGRYPSYSNTNFFDGEMSHVHFIDGTAYDADTFGETDSTTGIWKPKTSPSVTYGTNGFFLKFENSGAFGTDSSGNANNFTVNGTMTQTIDTPSNVFPTINPLTYSTTKWNLEYGNLRTNGLAAGESAAWRSVYGTLGASSGKYYFEMKVTSTYSVDPNYILLGIIDAEQMEYAGDNGNFTDNSRGYGYQGSNGNKVNAGSSSYGNTFTTNDIIGCAFDLDNHKIYFSKNGTWQNSGDPTSGATGTGSAFNLATGYTYLPAVAHFYDDDRIDLNFGNGYFGTTAVSSAQNPDDGIGIFEYDVPTGYRALCTKSINAEEYS